MDLFEIVMKLNGQVQPVGETNEDALRLNNIKRLTELTDRLFGEIDNAASNAKRNEISMRLIGEHAKEFIDRVTDVV